MYLCSTECSTQSLGSAMRVVKKLGSKVLVEMQKVRGRMAGQKSNSESQKKIHLGRSALQAVPSGNKCRNGHL